MVTGSPTLKNNANQFMSELVEFVNIPSVSADIIQKGCLSGW